MRSFLAEAPERGLKIKAARRKIEFIFLNRHPYQKWRIVLFTKLKASIFTAFIGCLVISLAFNAAAFTPAAAGSLPSIPAGLKTSLMLGLANQPGKISWLQNSGARWDARYQYLSGGVNTNGGWSTWNSPSGIYANYYMDESSNAGYLPVLTYYQMLQSSPASGGSEGEKDYNNLNNYSTMYSYFADFKLLMDRARIFGKPVIVHVEPDLWGFLQKRSTDPNSLGAAVNNSGYPDVNGYPNTVAGFARALVGLRDRYASNVMLAYHISPWASSFGDVSTNTDPGFNWQAAANETANFYRSLGANYDLLFYDISDRDAALYASWGNPNAWWDTNNQNFPNFNRFHQFVSVITANTGKRGMIWQIPVGNTIYTSMNNTNHHWQDNKVQYYLNDSGNQHLQDLANVGIVGLLFGQGDGQTTSYDDAAGDGVTNPGPINGNTRWSNYPDDDGGYLRLQGQAYYNRGVLYLPDSGSTAPAPTATPATAPPATATPTTSPAPTSTPPVSAPADWKMSAAAGTNPVGGSPFTLGSQFTAPTGANGSYLLDVEVFNPATNARVAQWSATRNFSPGLSYTFNNTLALGAGSYVVKLGVFTPAWSFIAWNDGAGTVQVGASSAPAATATPTASPTSTPTPASTQAPTNWQVGANATGNFTAGSTVNIQANFTAPAGASGNYQLDVEVFNLNTGQKVAQWAPVKSFAPGQTVSLVNSLNPGTGRYQVRMGVFTTGWAGISWINDGPVFTVN